MQIKLMSTIKQTKPIVVIKIGGSLLGSEDTTLEDVVKMQKDGSSPVVIHGGGPIISDWMKKQGTQPSFVRGLRVTDQESMDIVSAVLAGLVNKQLVSSIQALGGKVIGISGVDGQILQSNILDSDLGQVGRIVNVNTDFLMTCIENGYIPVISPIGVEIDDNRNPTGTILNINGDTAAGEIACSLKCESIIFLTDVAGILDQDRNLIADINRDGIKKLIDEKIVEGGMIPKVEACIRALDGVNIARIMDGRNKNALLSLNSEDKIGTSITSIR